MPSKKRASSPHGNGTEASRNAVRKTESSQRPSAAAAATSDDEIGEWEDRYEDEYESEDVMTDEEEDGDDEDLEERPRKDNGAVNETGDRVGAMDLDNQEQQDGDESIPYLPQLGQGSKELAEDEELVADLSSYVLLHHARLAWPCLSFDVLRDVRQLRFLEQLYFAESLLSEKVHID